ncbi:MULTISPECIES: hypothetical protein [unclassified Clostridium]|uniref:hypothetical protein n=1 Tax=unclassified Clostridium TaxID=2614128 RepID=UPI00207968C4|nr:MULTISPECIES: hypothetical protein [unclassified Clostridium]
MNNIKTEETLYDQFLKYSYKDLNELFRSAKTKEEQDFYNTLADMFLQKQQERIMGKI